VHGVIFEVVVKDALADTEVFVAVFANWLLEIDAEVEDLSVVLEPLRCNTRNRVVNLSRTFLSLEGGCAGSLHAFKQLLVYGLLQVGCLFSNNAVSNSEQLGLVVTIDLGVGVGHAGKEGQVLGDVC